MNDLLMMKETCKRHPRCKIFRGQEDTDDTCRYFKNGGCLMADPPSAWEPWMALNENEVLCIDDSCWVGSSPGYSRKLDLTIGKVYSMIICGRHYELTDDKGQTMLFPKHCFLDFKGNVMLE